MHVPVYQLPCCVHMCLHQGGQTFSLVGCTGLYSVRGVGAELDNGNLVTHLTGQNLYILFDMEQIKMFLCFSEAIHHSHHYFGRKLCSTETH